MNDVFEIDEHESSDGFATRIVRGQSLHKLLVMVWTELDTGGKGEGGGGGGVGRRGCGEDSTGDDDYVDDDGNDHDVSEGERKVVIIL